MSAYIQVRTWLVVTSNTNRKIAVRLDNTKLQLNLKNIDWASKYAKTIKKGVEIGILNLSLRVLGSYFGRKWLNYLDRLYFLRSNSLFPYFWTPGCRKCPSGGANLLGVYVCTKCKWQDLSRERRDIQHNDTQHNTIYAECRDLCIVILNGVAPSKDLGHCYKAYLSVIY